MRCRFTGIQLTFPRPYAEFPVIDFVTLFLPPRGSGSGSGIQAESALTGAARASPFCDICGALVFLFWLWWCPSPTLVTSPGGINSNMRALLIDTRPSRVCLPRPCGTR